MTTHLPLTTEVRSAYASSHDFRYSDDEARGLPRGGYANRALAFDAWLDATIAIAKSLGFAEGKAAEAASAREKDSL